MNLVIYCVSALLIGVLIATVFSGMRWRRTIDRTRLTAEAEHGLLTAQLKRAECAHDEATTKTRLLEKEKAQVDSQLIEANLVKTRLEERANRLEQLEKEFRELARSRDLAMTSLTEAREINGRISAERDGFSAQVSRAEEAKSQLQLRNNEITKEVADLRARVAELATALESEQEHAAEKLGLLQEARDQLTAQFKVLANQILEEKGQKFAEQNQLSLNTLLAPLKTQLTEFKAKVEEVYVAEGKDRSALAEQVKQLMSMNQALSEEASNLTLALKGDKKGQGTWGEIILDDVLERSGLLRDIHYKRQEGVRSEDGLQNAIPDVVIRLPGGRNLVVDSKLTLPDYRAFSSSDDLEIRATALKKHLIAVRAHIRGLSEKNYQSLYGLSSLDFVVMFVPLEPAFMLAVTNDSELFQFAWERNVLLVSPSTLLFVVRTVAYLWRQEDLSRNAKDISNRGAELYDKLVGFVDDLQKVGDRLNQAQASFSAAKKKLSEGNGNVIRQAEMLRELGVKPSKRLPASLLGALEEQETEECAVDEVHLAAAPTQ
jgi:DNA recombination protein RmuC